MQFATMQTKMQHGSNEQTMNKIAMNSWIHLKHHCVSTVLTSLMINGNLKMNFHFSFYLEHEYITLAYKQQILIALKTAYTMWALQKKKKKHDQGIYMFIISSILQRV